MIIKKSSLFFIFLIFAIGSWLFYIKYDVIQIEDRIVCAKRDIVVERRNCHILKAEWTALTNPERIQLLTMKHLDMRSIDPSQLHEYDQKYFHNEPTNTSNVKRLSKLIGEIFAKREQDDNQDN